jgi:hypothetical protein
MVTTRWRTRRSSLGELRVLPEVVLVVVLDDERDAGRRRVGQAGLDALGRQAYAFFTRELGAALPGENSTGEAAQGRRHVDPGLLLLDLLATILRVRVGEIGGAAEHRDAETPVLGEAPVPPPRGGLAQVQEAAVELEPVDLELARHLDPAFEGQRAVDAQPLYPRLGERGELGHQQITFGGLRPITGNWAISTTLPLMGRLSSPIQ